jgi:hypothetical protein
MNPTVVPSRDTELLAWLAQRQTPWTVNQQAISLSSAELNNFTDTTTVAQQAWQAWQNARQASTDASAAWRLAKKNARSAASAGVKSIRNYAQQQPDPQKVLGLAQLPAPKTPNFGVPPGQPSISNVSLDTATGALDIRFECNNPPGLSGTVYFVTRAVSTASNPTVFGPFTQVAVTSTKRFIDNSLIAGTPAAQYIITAQRGSIVGRPSIPATVSFGRTNSGGGGPGFTVTLDHADTTTTKPGSPKLAA